MHENRKKILRGRVEINGRCVRDISKVAGLSCADYDLLGRGCGRHAIYKVLLDRTSRLHANVCRGHSLPVRDHL